MALADREQGMAERPGAARTENLDSEVGVADEVPGGGVDEPAARLLS
jgi:hypothetical protein